MPDTPPPAKPAPAPVQTPAPSAATASISAQAPKPAAAPVPEAGPLFLLTTHRSGGTLLARIFNVHPDIVIWGEHAGLINKMAEMAELFRLHPVMRSPLKDRKLDVFLKSKATNTAFSPWISAVNPDDFRASSKALLTKFFSQGLTPGQRWGVKEIRYHSIETIRFIIDLFPNAKFVILQRDLLAQCVSNITADWSLKHLAAMGAGNSEEEALKVIDDCAYALAAIDVGLRKIAKAYPGRTKTIAYEALVAEEPGLTESLYQFASLPVTPELLVAARKMLAVRSGATPVTGSLGCITRELIHKVAPQRISDAYRSIAADDIDIARLRSRHGLGRYSFLVGDNEMKNSDFSTIF